MATGRTAGVATDSRLRVRIRFGCGSSAHPGCFGRSRLTVRLVAVPFENLDIAPTSIHPEGRRSSARYPGQPRKEFDGLLTFRLGDVGPGDSFLDPLRLISGVVPEPHRQKFRRQRAWRNRSPPAGSSSTAGPSGRRNCRTSPPLVTTIRPRPRRALLANVSAPAPLRRAG
jgi:hypothetical protein